MNARTGDFLRVETLKLSTVDSLEKQLVLDEFVQNLYEELVKNSDAVGCLRRLERGQLHDLMNVLLRYEEPAKWRDFAEATKKRKASNEGVARSFTKLAEWCAPLVSAANRLPDNHPLTKAFSTTRASIEAMLERERGADEMQQKWNAFLDEIEAGLRAAALREWLCLSIRRTLDERNIGKSA